MQQATPTAERADFRRGAQAMREAMAQWLMCGCDDAQRLRVIAAAAAGGDNCAARWQACGQSSCLALMAAETLDMPLPEDGADAASVPAVQENIWQPIENAATDQWVLVYAAPRNELDGFICISRHHPDAGWCVDEVRHCTHWRPLPPPPVQETSR